ncbi:hypothetical protein ACTXT7_013634 [Hymenolepis weldensis]
MSPDVSNTSTTTVEDVVPVSAKALPTANPVESANDDTKLQSEIVETCIRAYPTQATINLEIPSVLSLNKSNMAAKET